MSVTSQTKPRISTFRIVSDNNPTREGERIYNEYIYVESTGDSTLTLPEADNVYFGYQIRVSNLQPSTYQVKIAVRGLDTLVGSETVANGQQGGFMSGGNGKWYRT